MDIINIAGEIIDLPIEEFLNHILNLNVDLNLIWVDEHEPLIFSLIQKNRLDLIERLPELDLNVMHREIETPLHRATCIENLKIVEYLLQKGVDPNPKNIGDYTPFHWGCRNTDINFTSLFLSNGIDINQKTEEGFTGLHIACKYGNVVIVDFLLKNEAKVEYENYEPTCLKEENFYPHVTEEKINKVIEVVRKYQMKNIKGIPRKD